MELIDEAQVMHLGVCVSCEVHLMCATCGNNMQEAVDGGTLHR